ERGKGTGWIAWKPGRSRSRPRASAPAMGRRLNNDPGLKGPSGRSGAQAARHEPRRTAWTLEAKEISDRGCVAGRRSTPMEPSTAGKGTQGDRIEESGVPCGESR